MKKQNTRRALLMSALSILLCVSMLVGTTFAWFTDEVKSGKNQIVAGNLDIELEHKKVVNGVATDWAPVAGKADIFDPNALWEPGRVEVVYLKVSNLGTLALKYQLGVNVYNEITGLTEDDKVIKLSDHLVFKVVEMPDALATYTDREAVKLAAGTEKGLKDYNGNTTPLEAKSDDPLVNDEDYLALIVYMPESVGNEANYRGTAVPTIELGINLFATQYTQEEDSWGKDYDAMSRSNFKVNRALTGAALSIGANIEIIDAPGYAPLQNDKNMIDLARRAAAVAYPDAEFKFNERVGTGSTDMGDISLLFPSIHPYAPGATGTSHGDNYYIANPDLACTKSAEWQLAMLTMLLCDGAKEALRIKEEFTPMFASKEEYFDYIEQFYSCGNRIEYTDGKAEVKI